jgi:hypothetical protein
MFLVTSDCLWYFPTLAPASRLVWYAHDAAMLDKSLDATSFIIDVSAVAGAPGAGRDYASILRRFMSIRAASSVILVLGLSIAWAVGCSSADDKLAPLPPAGGAGGAKGGSGGGASGGSASGSTAGGADASAGSAGAGGALDGDGGTTPGDGGTANGEGGAAAGTRGA